MTTDKHVTRAAAAAAPAERTAKQDTQVADLLALLERAAHQLRTDGPPPYQRAEIDRTTGLLLGMVAGVIRASVEEGRPMGLLPYRARAVAHAVLGDGLGGIVEPPARTLAAEVRDCTCVEHCNQDPTTMCSLSGVPHVHPDDGSGVMGPCPVHPDRPGDR